MQLLPGKCCKCGCEIYKGNFQSSKFNEIIVEFDTGSICHVGICSDCFLEESEFEKLMGLLKQCNVNGNKLVKVRDRLTRAEILKDIQGSLCAVCGKPIGEKWAVTNNQVRHEGC